MIARAERPATTLVHAAGLLGATVIGWPVAALLSAAVLLRAVRARNALRVLQAGQAALFQMIAFTGHLLLLALASFGFIAFGGDLPILPEATFYVDPTSGGGLALMALWAVSVLALPVWYVATLMLAIRVGDRATDAALAGGARRRNRRRGPGGRRSARKRRTERAK
jgi:hypothetical protein